MSRAERDKGRRGEAEVRAMFEAHGFTVRGLEGAGDHLAIGHGLVIHSEAKRQEVLRLPLWSRQAAAEAPPDALPLVAYRRSRETWQALVPEGRVTVRLAVSGKRSGIDYSLRQIGSEWFVLMPLQHLLDALVQGARVAGIT